MSKDKDIVKIILVHSDGTIKESTKGFVCDITINENNADLAFNFCNINGTEIKIIVGGVMELGEKMGMFEDLEEGVTDAN